MKNLQKAGPSRPVRSLRFWPYHFLLGQFWPDQLFSRQKQNSILHKASVWEKFMVRNICEKKIRGKKFSSTQAIDKNF